MFEYVKITMVAALVLSAGVVICIWLHQRQSHKRKRAFARINDSLFQVPTPAAELRMPSNSICSTETRESVPALRHDRIKAFYRKYITPYQSILITNGYLEPITTLLSLLDEHGCCPSVIKVNQDHEYQALENVYDLLSKITLLDHSLNVAEQMIADVSRAKTKDPEMIMGKILVTALGHDIGKIPQLFDQNTYRKGDHPYISYLVLKNAIFDDSLPQQEEILAAVKSHHYQVREGFTHELRKADQAAREMEAESLSLNGESATRLSQVIHEQKAAESSTPASVGQSKAKGEAPDIFDLSWLDLEEFLQMIDPEINRVEKNSYFRAFSMNNGLVYLMLSLVSETVIRLAKQHHHAEALVNADTTEKKRRLEFTVKTMLAEKGLIPSFIGKGFSGARFGLIDATGRKKMVGIYMPIEARAFKTSLLEFEARKNKTPVLKDIVEVRPLVGQKK